MILMADKIYIKQINLHHCIGATSLIGNSLYSAQTKKQNLVVLIQEPWIHKTTIKGFDEKKFDLFYSSKSNEKPRTCIVTSKELKATLLPQFSSGGVTTIHINILNGNTNEELLLCSLYMPYEEKINIPCKMASDVINYSSDSGIPIIIGADCNAHHILWGSSDTNMRGEKLVEFLASTELVILNKGNIPTFSNKLRNEILDVTLASQQITNRIQKWKVSTEETLSDHKEINFVLECSVMTNTLFRNIRNTDWSTFNNVLISKLNKHKRATSLDSRDKLDKAVNFLTKSLNSAFVRACPGRINKPKKTTGGITSFRLLNWKHAD